jgi:hypothetical protein
MRNEERLGRDRREDKREGRREGASAPQATDEGADHLSASLELTDAE